MNFDTNFRIFLKSELSERTQQNPQYSLRAFARDLGISASILSEVLNRKHGLSKKTAEKIAFRLNLSPKETEIFCKLVEAEHSRSKVKRQLAQEELEKLKKFHESSQMQMDAFKIISDWYHYAILELTYLKDFKSNNLWMAKKLGITKIEVEVAIERMLRLGLLIVDNGKIEATEEFTASPDGISSEALRKFHLQLLTKAIDALTMQAVENRDVTSLVLAVEKRRLPEAKKRIKEFRREFNNVFSKGTKRDSVYCLGLQFFELTHREY